MPEPALVGFPEAEVDPLGPGLGGVLPGSLMAAAAGGGGAAGGGFAATRGAGTTQRNGEAARPGQADGATRARYRPPPVVVAQTGRQTTPAGQSDQSWSSESLRDEINDLRRQITDLAMERDVLMRSLALWARGSLDE
jgi:hypothetical protein